MPREHQALLVEFLGMILVGLFWIWTILMIWSLPWPEPWMGNTLVVVGVWVDVTYRRRRRAREKQA